MQLVKLIMVGSEDVLVRARLDSRGGNAANLPGATYDLSNSQSSSIDCTDPKLDVLVEVRLNKGTGDIPRPFRLICGGTSASFVVILLAEDDDFIHCLFFEGGVRHLSSDALLKCCFAVTPLSSEALLKCCFTLDVGETASTFRG